MRKLIIGACLTTLMSFASAQGNEWVLQAVPDSRDSAKPIVGYIYQTAAVGTQYYNNKSEKFVTKLELVCSTRSTEDPQIVLFWNTLFGNIPQTLEISIDNKKIEKSVWVQDGPILMKSIFKSAQIMQAMKVGRVIGFEWTDNNVRRVTMFNLRDFRSNFPEFTKSCNL